jgi:hypothetical protein
MPGSASGLNRRHLGGDGKYLRRNLSARTPITAIANRRLSLGQSPFKSNNHAALERSGLPAKADPRDSPQATGSTSNCK